MCKVEDQKKIAQEFLEMLEITDPNCILAGGAPRDWWFGKEANDLDFYVYWGDSTTYSEDDLRLHRLGIEGYRRMDTNPMVKLYGSIKELKRVWEVDFKGEKIQIMVMSAPTFNCVVERFGVSSSMVWFKSGKIRPTYKFLVSHLMKVNFIKDNYNAKETYIKKIKNKFPDYVDAKEDTFNSYKEVFDNTSKCPNWKLLNLGDNQTYLNAKSLYLQNVYEV